jgi:hypothetical protein
VKILKPEVSTVTFITKKSFYQRDEDGNMTVTRKGTPITIDMTDEGRQRFYAFGGHMLLEVEGVPEVGEYEVIAASDYCVDGKSGIFSQAISFS